MGVRGLEGERERRREEKRKLESVEKEEKSNEIDRKKVRDIDRQTDIHIEAGK